MQEIRMEYFFLPIHLQVQSNPGGEDVVVLQRTFLGTYEFLRLPVADAHEFAELLETAVENASKTPVDSETIGEINGTFVRALGTGKIRIRLSAKRLGSVRVSIRTAVGLRYTYGRPKITVEEARRFASSVRQANAVT